MIYIGSDHGGFNLKESLKKIITLNKMDFEDLGAAEMVDGDDFPPYAKKVSEAVQADLGHSKGILICRSGQGVCMVANKYKGIRASLCWSAESAKPARFDDDANVLCLPSDFVSEKQAEEITLEWLNTPFSFEERHVRRLKEIE
jgi:ribose 5-phosphate isomerase B